MGKKLRKRQRAELSCSVQTLHKKALKNKPVLNKYNTYVTQIWFNTCQFITGINVTYIYILS